MADAPSRAPWESSLAQFLPIPDMPIRDLVVQMYQDPDALEQLVSKRRKVLTGDTPFEPLREPEEEPSGPFLDEVQDDKSTATFGVTTPSFGSEAGYIAEETAMFGRGRVLFGLLEQGPWWPRWPRLAMEGPISEQIWVGKEMGRAYPRTPIPHPAIAIERHKDKRGYNYCVRFRDAVWFDPDPI